MSADRKHLLLSFVEWLAEAKPAIGVPFYGYGLPEWQGPLTTCYWDHCLVAYHRNVTSWLSHYTTDFDSQSWWFADKVIAVLAAALLPKHVVVDNRVAALNTMHR